MLKPMVIEPVRVVANGNRPVEIATKWKPVEIEANG